MFVGSNVTGAPVGCKVRKKERKTIRSDKYKRNEILWDALITRLYVLTSSVTGLVDGFEVGTSVTGESEGLFDGFEVGTSVTGLIDGFEVGTSVTGELEGLLDGFEVGTSVTGLVDGFEVGTDVTGDLDGCELKKDIYK